MPLDLRGDARFNLMTIRNLIEQGWFQRSDRLGAPFGLDLHDFPLGGSNLQFILLRLLALTGASAGAVMNAYLVVTFVGVAVTTGPRLPLARDVGKGGGSPRRRLHLLPYHFYRGEHHLFLSAYWSVPLAAYLASLALTGPAPVRTAPRRPRHHRPPQPADGADPRGLRRHRRHRPRTTSPTACCSSPSPAGTWPSAPGVSGRRCRRWQ